MNTKEMSANLTGVIPSSLLGLLLVLSAMYFSPIAIADEKIHASNDITTLYRSARKVISDNQALINEKRSGKNFTADFVVATAKKNYKAATGSDLNLKNDPYGGKAAMFAAVRGVVDSAQDLINDPEVGFKGFLPAIFARQVATAFGEVMENKMTIKLTAPKKYVRNRANRPDKWESKVIDGMFAKPDYEKGKPYFVSASVKGKSAFRYILPEYYGESCLGCHGTPRGALDITGGKKEGGELGELGGAISLVIYD